MKKSDLDKLIEQVIAEKVNVSYDPRDTQPTSSSKLIRIITSN